MRRLIFARLGVAAATCLFASMACAAGPSVTAVLSNADAQVGEMVQLQIRVTGDRQAEAPDTIDVEGLEIHRTGTEQHFEMNNLSVTSSVSYSYTILPQRAGTFKIPPQSIRIAGKELKTPELTLKVTDGGAGGARSAQRGAPRRGGNNGAGDTAALGKNAAFLELVVPKRKGYVGEVLPIELRLGFNSRINLQRYEPPEIAAKGILLQKAQKPTETTETISGIVYDVLTWKGAISATTAGKIEVPPLKSEAVVLMPRRARPAQQPRNPFDPFGGDPFNDPFFRDFFGSMPEPRQITVTSEPVSLEIQPLPPNAPPTFTGAVGNFGISADANPKTVGASDPITVTANVTGRGNFDRVNAPSLEDERGWHKYPPTGKFKQDDDVGISGAKTFEMVLSTTEPKQAIPPLLFTYFDPLKESYVTARTQPVPVKINGGTASTTAAAGNTNVAAATPPTSPRGSAAQSNDILHVLNERGRVVTTFAPLYARPIFWIAQLIPAALLAGLIAFALRRRALNDRAAREAAATRRQLDTLLRELRGEASSSADYYAKAARAVQLKTAMRRGGNPDAIDAGVAADTFRVDEKSREELRRIFEVRDELRYSGRAANGELSPERRREVVQLIDSLRA